MGSFDALTQKNQKAAKSKSHQFRRAAGCNKKVS
jgi:hypothetical protein